MVAAVVHHTAITKIAFVYFVVIKSMKRKSKMMVEWMLGFMDVVEI